MAQRAGQDYCAQTKHLAVRVHFGRDSQTGTRKQHNQTIYSRFREVPASSIGSCVSVIPTVFRTVAVRLA
jgi:hypothetical protein